MTDKQNYFTYIDNTSDDTDKTMKNLYKQVTIDGVDVGGCEYYFDNKCRCMDASIMQDFYSCYQCNSNPNCHYKLYKRKKQECEELKAERDSWHYQWEKRYEIGECLSDKIDQYKQAIEKVREYSKCGRDMFMQRSSHEDYEVMAEWMGNQFYFILQICDEVLSE